MERSHFLIVGLDGLRADMMTPETTPNLLRLAEHGVHFRQHHATFPTATRVNVASLITGAHSGTHGIVNNSIFEPSVNADSWVDLGLYDMVEAADAHYQGGLLSTPSLGEILAGHGDTMMAVSSGTTGSNRIMHHKVKSLGSGFFRPWHSGLLSHRCGRVNRGPIWPGPGYGHPRHGPRALHYGHLSRASVSHPSATPHHLMVFRSR